MNKRIQQLAGLGTACVLVVGVYGCAQNKPEPDTVSSAPLSTAPITAQATEEVPPTSTVAEARMPEPIAVAPVEPAAMPSETTATPVTETATATPVDDMPPPRADRN